MFAKILLWIGTALVLLLVAGLVYGNLTREMTNARVAEEIRHEPEGERAARTMLLTMEDGRMYPVNYLYEGNKVFMGIDGFWWREFADEAKPVSMYIKGETYTGQALTILDRPEYIKDVFSRLRPTVPKWLPDALNGKLVEITLDPASIEKIQEAIE